MAKKNKSSMALFEVVSRTKDKTRKTPLSVPDWMKRPPGTMDDLEVLSEPPPTPEPSAEADSDPDFEAVVDPAEQQGDSGSETVVQAADETDGYVAVEAPVSQPAEADPCEMPLVDGDFDADADFDADVDADAEVEESYGSDGPDGSDGPNALDGPMVSIAGRRVTLSLNYVSCAVVGVSVVFVLLVTFALGRLSVDRTVPTSEPAQQGPVKAALGVGHAPEPGPVARRARPQRISGKYYLVIKRMDGREPAHRAAAEKIVAYCEAVRGDQATVLDDGTRYRVLSGAPFDRESPEALEYAADIHVLGMRYKTDENSKYDFNQLDHQGRLAPVFEKER